MSFTQENRSIFIDTPLGKDVLLLVRCAGTEEISSLFSFELEMLSENHNVALKDIIGKNVTVSIILADGSKRYFNGIISRFSQGRGGGGCCLYCLFSIDLSRRGFIIHFPQYLKIKRQCMRCLLLLFRCLILLLQFFDKQTHMF
jgi:hypothetical protein